MAIFYENIRLYVYHSFLLVFPFYFIFVYLSSRVQQLKSFFSQKEIKNTFFKLTRPNDTLRINFI